LDPIDLAEVEEEAGTAVSRGGADEDENVGCRDNNDDDNDDDEYYANALNN